MSMQRDQAVQLLEWLDEKGYCTILSTMTIKEVVGLYMDDLYVRGLDKAKEDHQKRLR